MSTSTSLSTSAQKGSALSSSKGFAPILIVFMLAIATSLGGFLIYQNSKTKPPPTPFPQQTQSTPAPKKTEATNSAETANWQTINLKQLSFRIPQNWWNERDQTIGKNNAAEEFVYVDSVASGVPGNVNKPALAVSFFPDTDMNQAKIDIMRGLSNPTTTTATVAGITGVMIEGVGVLNPIVENGRGDIKIILLQRPEGIYSIVNNDFFHSCKLRGGNDTLQTMSDYCTPIYNQILSTFKFLP